MRVDQSVGSKIIEQRECEICGAYFNVTARNRKYCDKCQIHPETEKRHLEWAYQDSKRRMYEPKVIEVECELCHKTVKTIWRLVFRFTENDKVTRHLFCSEKCLETAKRRYNKETKKCIYCGKSLIDSAFYDGGADWRFEFCNESCKEKEMAKRRKPALYKKCERCGKSFLVKNQKYFCSRECHMAALKSGWKSPSKEGAFPQIYICPICGKKWETLSSMQQPPMEVGKEEVCPDAQCAAAWESRLKEERKKTKKGAKTAKVTDVAGGTEQLCATCKVPYTECERMQTNFRVLPKGARYNSEGVLVVCPKYEQY